MSRGGRVLALGFFASCAIFILFYLSGSKDFHVDDHVTIDESVGKVVKKHFAERQEAAGVLPKVRSESSLVDSTSNQNGAEAGATDRGDDGNGDRAEQLGKSPLDPFVNDPSFSTRCAEKPVPIAANCPRWPLPAAAVAVPDLMAPISTGQTTKGMTLQKMSQVVGKPVPHHPVFATFAATAFAPKWLENRVVEFTGAHTDYTYDCGEEVDFRLYHQCRAAMCVEYEERRATIAATNSTQIGMFPLNDEEYFEMVMTLTTALQAAEEGRGYTFIELGARYGTWIVRAGAAFRMMSRHLRPAKREGPLRLLAVEGNCGWFLKMREHVECNGFLRDADLVLSYAAPRSFNKVVVGNSATYKEPRAVSLLDMLPAYEFVDMMDFDIQGFEWMTIQEDGAFDLMTTKVGFVHFGTHSTDIERNIVTHAQAHEWCVVYFFAGAHTKKLNRGHRCSTPYGPSVFNDGVLGIANLKFYPQLRGKCSKLSLNSLKKTASTCHSIPEAVEMLRRTSR